MPILQKAINILTLQRTPLQYMKGHRNTSLDSLKKTVKITTVKSNTLLNTAMLFILKMVIFQIK